MLMKNQIVVAFFVVVLFVGAGFFTLNFRKNISYLSRLLSDRFSRSFSHPLMSYNGTLKNSLHFYYLLHKTTTTCKKPFIMGGTSCNKHSDTTKEICLDTNVVPTSNNCTVLSFGVDDQAEFEDQIEMAFGCQIHLFDPQTPHSDSVELSDSKIVYHPVGNKKGHVNLKILRKKLEKIQSTLTSSVHIIKISLWKREWQVLNELIELGFMNDVLQLTFFSHLNFLKKLRTETWRDRLQGLMDILEKIQKKGLNRVKYNEIRNRLASIQFPGDDIPRPSCGQFLYIRKTEENDNVNVQVA